MLLPSVVGFRMLVVMSCGRGHVMYHILSHNDLYSSLLFYFFYLIPYSVERGWISPRTHISYPQLDSDEIFWILSAIFPNVPLRFMHIGGPFRFSSYSYTPVSSSLCHSFYHFYQKCEIYTLKPFCIQADIPFHPAYKNSQIIRPKLSIKVEFITKRTDMPCLQ